MLHVGCLESRACFAECQGAAAAAGPWGGSAGKGGLCPYGQCVGFAADGVCFPGSAKPAPCLII